MWVCGLLEGKSGKRFYRRCPNNKPQQNPSQRDFRLIIQAGGPAFFAFYTFFPVVGTVKVSGSFMDKLTNGAAAQGNQEDAGGSHQPGPEDDVRPCDLGTFIRHQRAACSAAERYGHIDETILHQGTALGSQFKKFPFARTMQRGMPHF